MLFRSTGTGSSISLVTPTQSGDLVDLIGFQQTNSSSYQLLISNTTSATSNTTGSLVISGGVGMTGNLYTGNLFITGASSNGITFADGTRMTTAASGTGSASLGTIVTTVKGWDLP